MIKLQGSEEYYPTPEKLLDAITFNVDWEKVETLLEPSAGTGNICEYLRKERTKIKRYSRYGVIQEYEFKYIPEIEIDCIEIEPEFRAILKDKGFRIVHNDFLTYETCKHYDMILMNPPFNVGARHLLKAIELQEQTGGEIICILNAETIKNPYTHERQDLQSKLAKYQAEVKYYEKAFAESDRPTEVEVAAVRMIVPKREYESRIYEELREKEYEVHAESEPSYEVSEQDIVKMFVSLYKREVEWGLRLYQEYCAMKKNCLDGISQVEVKIRSGECGSEYKFSVNDYIKYVRGKYWEKLFRHPRITGRLTSNLQSEYLSQIDKLSAYDFSYWNIKTIQEELSRRLVSGVESSILELFEELSYEHSYDEDLKHNIHYYNGWKTNSAWKINRKVIIPLRVHTDNQFLNPNLHRAVCKLADIEKVLNYLDNGETCGTDIESELREADRSGNFRKIQLKYFEVTFYKKGTCHLTFRDERLLKKFNIYGSQGKHWLPKEYGKRKYEEMSFDERAVIESFEGKDSYEETLRESEYYLSMKSPLMLEAGEA